MRTRALFFFLFISIRCSSVSFLEVLFLSVFSLLVVEPTYIVY